MQDINNIKENLKDYQNAAKNKGVEIDFGKLISLEEERKELQSKGDELRAKRNSIADDLKDDKKRTPEKIKEGKKVKDELSAIEESERKVKDEIFNLSLLVPNISSDDTPIGSDESFNKEVSKVGKLPKFDFQIKDHIELGTSLDILDLEKGVKVAGFRGYFLKNEGAQMQMAVLQYTFDKLISKGFTPMIVPVIVREESLVNMGQFPLHKEETYELNSGVDGEDDKEKKYLAGTSEVALLNYYANETIDKSKLPIKMCGFSSCFRSEAGSHGKDTKGLYRVHEFMKVEQVVIAENNLDSSLKILEEMRGISEELLDDLKLPYRVIITSTGDQGIGKHKMYDIETWMPSREGYGETHSDSLLTDWQARRANIKYKDGDEIKYVHTLNNTGVALPRILIAIWENYQQADGSIKIPEVLIPYMQGKSEIK